MDFTFNGKPIIPTKTAMDELSNIDMDLSDVPGILETGFPIKKRAKNIIEKGIQRGNKVVNVVVVDLGNYYKLIHAGQNTYSKKFRKMKRENNGT
ncbi:MAG: hypothetical protein ABIJ21_03645 [Nanoarchaeota archaeon]